MPWYTSFVVYNGQLIVGGDFTSIDSMPYAHIAAWNGTKWSAVGSGVTDVGTMTVYEGDLVIYGNVTLSSGKHATIARWNGSTWDSIPFGFQGYYNSPGITSMVEYNGKLFVGGFFTAIGGNPVNNLACWNDTNWSSVGYGTNGDVWGMSVCNNKICIGGNFTYVNGSIAANNLACWNDTVWSNLGGGVDSAIGGSTVDAFTTYNGNIVAGGTFRDAGGNPASGIAQWNGTSWSALGSGVNQVIALTTYNGNLIAGGAFPTAGGNPINNIAQWNGSSWSSLGSSSFIGSSSNYCVQELITYNSKLYAIVLYENTTTKDGYTYLEQWDGTKWSAL